MNKALTRNESWFCYYWSPTSLIGKHSLTKVDFGVPFAGKDHWDNCIVKPEKECANPKKSAWTTSVVNTVVTSNFMKFDVTTVLTTEVVHADFFGFAHSFSGLTIQLSQ